MENQFSFVGTDTETTGINPRRDEIVEVSVVEFNLSGITGRELTFRCRPESGFIPIEVSKINGIYYDQVKDCPNYLKNGIREKIAEFVGDRTLVGHNLIDFDLKFLKIVPKAVEDTLKTCREQHRGANNLKAACKRVLNVEWDDSQAHGSLYDTKMCIKLFCKLQELKGSFEKERQMKIFNSSAIPGVSPEELFAKLGVKPTDQERSMVATQPYSYSRISLFNQCPFKWFMQYIRKYAEPKVDYLIVGNVCHKVAEWAGQWCYRELLIRKIETFFTVKKLVIPDAAKDVVAKGIGIEPYNVGYRELASHLIAHQDQIKPLMGFENLSRLVIAIDSSIREDAYESPGMPPYDMYTLMIRDALNHYNVIDTDIINDATILMNRFYNVYSFSTIPGDVLITEKKMAFDKEWKPLTDFFDNRTFFRGVLDVIDYSSRGRCLIITDYKTSRKMLTMESLKSDTQLKVYVLLATMFVPRSGYDRVIVRITYIRFGKTIEYEIPDIDQCCKDAKEWIDSSIQKIEREMLITDGTAFKPIRNQHCGSCHIGNDSVCPLFNKQLMGDIGSVDEFAVNSKETCVKAWKRIEANKAENSKLLRLCKAFIENCEDRIVIDGTAALDFYTEEKRVYFQVGLTQMLLEKGVDIKDILHFASFSESSIDELLTSKEVKLSPEELERISKVRQKKTFDAFTQKEIEEKGFLNA